MKKTKNNDLDLDQDQNFDLDSDFETEEDNINSEEEFDLKDFDNINHQYYSGSNDDYSNVTSSLELAAKLQEPSIVGKQFKEMSSEVKNAFLTEKQAKEVLHKAKTYRNFQYIRKTLILQRKEDIENLKYQNLLYSIENMEDLKEFFILNNKEYLYRKLQQTNKLNLLLNYVRKLRPSGIDEDLGRMAENINFIYSEYKNENKRGEFLDDTGLLGDIISESVISSGTNGNERRASIMTINASQTTTTVEDNREYAKEGRVKGILSRIKNKLS